jgi:PAS domain S-box-containing protein
MQIHDFLTDETLNKIVTGGSIITAVGIFWKKILAFLKFFYRAYLAIDKIEAIEKQVHGNGGGSLPDKIDKLIHLVTELKNDIFRLHQVQIVLTNDGDYGFFYCDLEGYNKEVNRVYSKKLGVQTEDLLGKNYINYIDNYKDYEEIWEEAFEERRNLEVKVNFRKEDIIVPATIKATLIHDSNGPCGYVGFVHFD